ncbi:MAG TPA: hypothetical protein VI894_01015 [Candidatus Nanoarchaeia archaeon]|nr:hypothetical protein [Candidatus Nanoarchaeia archaeon]
MRKKGDLSINVVVIAAIALIVLVVLIVIFTNRFGVFTKTVKNCETQGGVCKASCDAGTEGTLLGTDCEQKSGLTKCCKPVEQKT